MRDITEKIYTATVRDGDEKHVMFYRRPEPKEIAAYQAGLFERKGNKIITRASETRIKFGKRILTGFKKGTFGIGAMIDGERVVRPISSDSTDPDYREDWKELLAENMPDVVAAVGHFAFEGTAVVGGEIEKLELGAEDLDDEDPQMPEGSIS
ncbi:MAG: hypothetical protein AB9866_21680 [Syntrophobacteraceae bacterium]